MTACCSSEGAGCKRRFWAKECGGGGGRPSWQRRETILRSAQGDPIRGWTRTHGGVTGAGVMFVAAVSLTERIRAQSCRGRGGAHQDRDPARPLLTVSCRLRCQPRDRENEKGAHDDHRRPATPPAHSSECNVVPRWARPDWRG